MKRYLYTCGLLADTKTMESVDPDGKRKKLTASEKKFVLGQMNKKHKPKKKKFTIPLHKKKKRCK